MEENEEVGHKTRLAEYIWIDGTIPNPLIRSKTKVITTEEDPPIWGFDGSSTKQAEGKQSDCVLRPCMVSPDPFRGYDNILVLCEVWTPEDRPHETNQRAICRQVSTTYNDHEPWFGMEQEYTLMKNELPLGFPEKGFPAPQGDYYCSAGGTRVFGRKIAEQHLAFCLYAGLTVSGINAEVCPGQWEYQIGPCDPLTVSDQMWVARYIMERITEEHEIAVSWAGKPVKGDWNGAGCHTNFSTKQMRESYDACIQAAEALGESPMIHVANYGDGIVERLTGEHETCSFEEFKYGVSDRTASVRIPWQVAKNKKGYIEDRRPNANCDPYIVTRLITDTICSKY
jgi:glutamine synthetase